MRAAAVAFLAAGLLPALAACSRPGDRDRLAACASAADAIAAPVPLRVIRSATLPVDEDGRPGLRLDVAPAGPGAGPPWIDCRFAAGRARADVAALRTPGGAVDDTHLWLLKRYWLGGAEAASAAAEREARDLPTLPFGAAYALQQALNALPAAGAYGLLAASYSLVHGLCGRINLAFGEIAAVGGLAAVAAAAVARDGPALPLLLWAGSIALWASALHGGAIEGGVLWRLRAATGQQGLVATVGVALALREYLRLAAGARPHWLQPILSDPFRLARAGGFVVTVTPMALLLSAAAAMAGACLLAGHRWSAFGRDWRAAADDPLAAALLGVDPRRLSLRTATLASALAGLAAAGMAFQHGGIDVDDATGLSLKALAAAVLGGIGSVPGALLGGSGVAAFEAAWSSCAPVEHRDLATDILLVAALVFRPNGLLGARGLPPRRSR